MSGIQQAAASSIAKIDSGPGPGPGPVPGMVTVNGSPANLYAGISLASGNNTVIPLSPSPFNATVYIWGAGGGTGSYPGAASSLLPGSSTYGTRFTVGGAGGYTAGNLTFQAGVSYNFAVGSGGQYTTVPPQRFSPTGSPPTSAVPTPAPRAAVFYSITNGGGGGGGSGVEIIGPSPFSPTPVTVAVAGGGGGGGFFGPFPGASVRELSGGGGGGTYGNWGQGNRTPSGIIPPASGPLASAGRGGGPSSAGVNGDFPGSSPTVGVSGRTASAQFLGGSHGKIDSVQGYTNPAAPNTSRFWGNPATGAGGAGGTGMGRGGNGGSGMAYTATPPIASFMQGGGGGGGGWYGGGAGGKSTSTTGPGKEGGGGSGYVNPAHFSGNTFVGQGGWSPSAEGNVDTPASFYPHAVALQSGSPPSVAPFKPATAGTNCDNPASLNQPDYQTGFSGGPGFIYAQIF